MNRATALLACLTLGACAREEAPRLPQATPPDAAPRSIAVPPAEPEAAPAGRAAIAEAPRGAPMLFWGTDADGLTYSIWVSEGAAGLERIEAIGAVIAVDGALWQWVEREQPLASALDCDTLELTRGRETSGAHAFLDRVGGGARIDVFVPDVMAAREASDWEETVELVGSLGPYVFARRSVYSHHCGAHGGVESELFAFDARTGNPVELLTEAERGALAPLIDRARAGLATENDGEPLLFDDELAHTAYWPALDANGVRIVHQWTAETCYACSDGEWDSYTISTQVPGSEMPAELAPHAAGVEEAVRWLATELPELTIRGVSRPKPEHRAAFEALPAEGC